MNTRMKYVIIASLCFTFITAGAQQKTAARKELLNAAINRNVSVAEVKEVTMPQGQQAPKHLHPCPVVGYILSGKVLFQIEGEESKILNEGDAFYEPANKTILHFDNAQKDKPLIFVAFYLKDQNEATIKLLEK